MKLSVPLILEMAPVILRAVLDGTRSIQNTPNLIEQRCRKLAVRTSEGWSPEAGKAPLGPGAPREGPARGSSRVPSGRTKKQTICTIPNPQASARKKKVRTIFRYALSNIGKRTCFFARGGFPAEFVSCLRAPPAYTRFTSILRLYGSYSAIPSSFMSRS